MFEIPDSRSLHSFRNVEPGRVSVRALFLLAAGGTAAVVRRYTQRLLLVVLHRLHRPWAHVSFEYVEMYLFGYGSAVNLLWESREMAMSGLACGLRGCRSHSCCQVVFSQTAARCRRWWTCSWNEKDSGGRLLALVFNDQTFGIFRHSLPTLPSSGRERLDMGTT